MSVASRRAQKRVRRLASLCLLAAACSGETDSAPAVLHLGQDTVVLSPGARITDVHVRTRAGQPEFLPDSVEVHPGDVIRFSSEDRGPHALVFDSGATDPAAFGYLERSGQSRSLPLTEEGAAWVVLLEDAPAGHYAVRCLTHDATMIANVSPAGR